jgi:hypothetical protein
MMKYGPTPAAISIYSRHRSQLRKQHTASSLAVAIDSQREASAACLPVCPMTFWGRNRVELVAGWEAW